MKGIHALSGGERLKELRSSRDPSDFN